MSHESQKSVSYVLSRSVSKYMTKDVLILSKDTRTTRATQLLQRYERDDIIVTDEHLKPVGIVTDEDILAQVSDVTVYAETTKLGDIMTSPLITIDKSSSLREALEKMKEKNIRKLPVISNNIVVGIIYQATIANVIRNASTLHPRFVSTPVKAILGNLVLFYNLLVFSYLFLLF